MWIPSLFFGTLPWLLLWGSLRKTFVPKYSLFFLTTLFCLLASFGNYSLGWILRCVFDATLMPSFSARLPPDHVTSVYGLLAECLPGYGVFRYPAKWSTLTVALAISAASLRFSQLNDTELLRTPMIHRVTLWLSAAGLLLTLVLSNLPLARDTIALSIRSDAWLGQLNEPSMFHQLEIAFLIPLIVLGYLSCLRWRQRRTLVATQPSENLLHAWLAWGGLLEMLFVASHWCSFVPLHPSTPAGPTSSEFVWSDVSEANIERDRWLTATTVDVPGAIAEYQRTFALGKLGLLSNKHNLASMLSIEPQSIRQLRTGLNRLDNLSSTQPELDHALAWLGVEKRLVRSIDAHGVAMFGWQPVPACKQLCELICPTPADATNAKLRWHWVRCGQLEIEIDSPAEGHLIVRQFNDDGWRVLSDGPSTPALARDRSGLFVDLPIESGKSRLRLERIQWPRQLGWTISGASLIFTLIACGHANFASRRRQGRDQSN